MNLCYFCHQGKEILFVKNEKTNWLFILQGPFLGLMHWLIFFSGQKVIEREKLCFLEKKPPASNFEQIFRALADAWISKNYGKIRLHLNLLFPYGFHMITDLEIPTEHIARTSLHQEP